MSDWDETNNLGRINTNNEHFSAGAQVRDDGRVNIHLNEKASYVTKYLARTRGSVHGHLLFGEQLTKRNKKYEPIVEEFEGVPRINIAIHIVGSRGDVQPFIAIGQILSQPPYGHRVRICTHPVFKDFVEENGLEFFSIGGDPATLMAYMVKNPGLMPGMESLKAGDVGKRRDDIREIIEGCWRSCIEPGNGMGHKTTVAQLSREAEADQLFIADAIIANPPSYAHIHCAEKLGIPLHMMFTMPWSPTQYFPHPLASMERHDSEPNFANYISYTMMELLAWQGLGDVINGFRVNTLHLDPISPLWGHMLLARMKVPFTYAWSSALISKPPDWGPHINISGFSFLKANASFKPPEDLVTFLDAGPPPVYIGFGSIVVDHPEELTKMIFGAVKRTGVRALVSKGWGGLGGDEVPEGIFMLGNVPHDWLFQYVSCVVHHGGAGTTAIGIAMGKPTVVVPFFGDQPFWGSMIFRAGAGPEPVPFKKMTEESLAHSITTALGPEIQTAVTEMSKKIAGENGAADAAASFAKSVNLDSMRCMICSDKVATWRVRKTNVRLSTKAVAVLIDNNKLTLRDVKLVRHRDWYVDEGPEGPLAGLVGATSQTITSEIGIVVDYSKNMHKSIHKDRKVSVQDSESTPEPEDPSVLAKSESLTYIPSTTRHVMRDMEGGAYTSQHIEGLAYRMAAKTLPTRTKREMQKRAKSWPASMKIPTIQRTTTPVETHDHGVAYDVAHETGTFAHRMSTAALRGPVSLFYNLANGFHNAPSFLLHDNTVRRRNNITGFGSGLKSSGKEFTLGLFDAFTGLVYQPYLGAAAGSASGVSGGVVGFGKGIGKGLGGFVFKVGAAGLGIPGYTLKGIERQVEKRKDRMLKADLLVVRLRQGIWEFGAVEEEEKKRILEAYEKLEG